MKPISLNCSDFASYKEMRYDFENKPLLIEGRNETDDSQKSNGSGKSGIMAAMQFLLTGNQYIYMETESKPLPKKNLIRRGTTKAYLSTEIHCPIRKETLKIERTILNSGGGIQLSVNGDVKISFDDKQSAMAETFLSDWVGIDTEDLLNFYLISKEKYVSLFRSNAKSKIELLNRFSSAKEIAGIDELVKADVSRLEKEKDALVAKKNQLIGSIATLKEQLEQQESIDFEAQKTKRIEAKEARIETIKDEIKKGFESINKLNTEISTLEKEKDSELQSLKQVQESLAEAEKNLKSFIVSDVTPKINSISKEIDSVNEKVSERDLELKECQALLSDSENQLSEIEKKLRGSVSCPKCKHEFLLSDPKQNVETLKEEKLELVDIIKEINSSITEIKASKSELNDALTSFERKISAIRQENRNESLKKDALEKTFKSIQADVKKSESVVNNASEKIEALQLKIKSVERQENSYLEQIKEFEREIKEIKAEKQDKSSIKLIEGQIKEKESELKEQERFVLSKEEEIFKTNQWVFNFKKFSFFLASKPLNLIQDRCNYFLKRMKTDLRVKMEGMKVKSDGSFKEEINPIIIRDGVYPFGSFSGGERAKLDFSMILAIQSLVNSTNQFGGLEFLMIDEVLEGLDDLGLKNLMLSINDFNFPILMTTHVVDTSVGIDKLVVVKQNGISKILTNE